MANLAGKAMLTNSHPEKSDTQLSFLIIGAGSRGNAYANALGYSLKTFPTRIGAVAEPIESKRRAFQHKHIRPHEYVELFETWQQFVDYEEGRRKRKDAGEHVPEGVDGVFVCTLDEMHVEIITALAPLGLHIMSEKPLATTLSDCLKIYRSLQPPGTSTAQAIFSIGHVLRYSPHNMLLRKLLLEDDVIGDILSIEHTEPVGWWHFSHSYVRGNWRKESTTAPSLLTKSCHDIDLLLWLLCSSPISSNRPPHLPSHVNSTGSLLYFKKSRKPAQAADATNCLSCAAESECLYSAKKIYEEGHLAKGNGGWPINIVDSEIEDMMSNRGKGVPRQRLMERLAEDYDSSMSQTEVDRRPWFGRCVYESDNDVCDDQVVTIDWEDDPLPRKRDESMESLIKGRGAKIATFHMVAPTEKQCERRGRVYGTQGEIKYDSKIIHVYDFATKQTRTHYPDQPGGGHGGGDVGLAQQFVKAIAAVKMKNMTVDQAQKAHIGCTLEEVIRSHAMVFAAEESRKQRKVVDWAGWWDINVERAKHLSRLYNGSD
ncbi:hypothetical protein N7G274_001793 [Stereocaulon virgatum]|uniref:Streptomycin biosynthesis protein StrI n=1 Tax=Stereocaulon virgatum TaxID=373712 RepID=A0ABR4ALG8_9LECA